MILPLLSAAEAHGLKICLHLEPYEGRTPASVKDDVRYAIAQYGHHPSFLRLPRPHSSGPALPVFYVYDSYHNSPDEWSAVLAEEGRDSIRGSEADAFMVFLLVERQHAAYARSGFDAFYTYFAADGAVLASASMRRRQGLRGASKAEKREGRRAMLPSWARVLTPMACIMSFPFCPPPPPPPAHHHRHHHYRLLFFFRPQCRLLSFFRPKLCFSEIS